MRNQRLIFYLVAILDLLNMINGSYLDCGTHEIRFQSKKGNLKLNTQCTIAVPFFSSVDLPKFDRGGTTIKIVESRDARTPCCPFPRCAKREFSQELRKLRGILLRRPLPNVPLEWCHTLLNEVPTTRNIHQTIDLVDGSILPNPPTYQLTPREHTDLKKSVYGLIRHVWQHEHTCSPTRLTPEGRS